MDFLGKMKEQQLPLQPNFIVSRKQERQIYIELFLLKEKWNEKGRT